MSKPRTLFDKIRDGHVVTSSADGESLLYVDRNFVLEGSFLAFEFLEQAGAPACKRDGSGFCR